MRKFLVVIIFIVCLATGARAQITGSTKLTVGSTQASSQGVLSGCTYIGSGGCSLPAGWALVAQQDFECSNSHAIPANPSCGTLPGNQVTSASFPNTPNVFETTQAHGGTYGFGGLYGGDGDQVDWILNNGVIGSFKTMYLSYWEYVDSNATYPNSDYYYFQSLGTAICGSIPAGTAYDAEDFNVPTLPGTTAWVGAGGEGDPGDSVSSLPNCNNQFQYNTGKNVPLAPGTWRQIEVLYTPSTTFTGNQYQIPSAHCTTDGPGAVGCGNGEQRMYINGQLVEDNLNVNLNGSTSMTNATVQAGGVITNFCDANGTRTQFFASSCPKYSPPPFHRYFDDIIVIKQ
jgi:hypothetical protein